MKLLGILPGITILSMSISSFSQDIEAPVDNRCFIESTRSQPALELKNKIKISELGIHNVEGSPPAFIDKSRVLVASANADGVEQFNLIDLNSKKNLHQIPYHKDAATGSCYPFQVLNRERNQFFISDTHRPVIIQVDLTANRLALNFLPFLGGSRNLAKLEGEETFFAVDNKGSLWHSTKAADGSLNFSLDYKTGVESLTSYIFALADNSLVFGNEKGLMRYNPYEQTVVAGPTGTSEGAIRSGFAFTESGGFLASTMLENLVLFNEDLKVIKTAANMPVWSGGRVTRLGQHRFVTITPTHGLIFFDSSQDRINQVAKIEGTIPEALGKTHCASGTSQVSKLPKETDRFYFASSQGLFMIFDSSGKVHFKKSIEDDGIRAVVNYAGTDANLFLVTSKSFYSVYELINKEVKERKIVSCTTAGAKRMSKGGSQSDTNSGGFVAVPDSSARERSDRSDSQVAPETSDNKKSNTPYDE